MRRAVISAARAPPAGCIQFVELDLAKESILQSPQGKAAIENIATAFGLEPLRASAAVSSLADALTRRVERNTLSRGGVADIVELLGEPSAGRALSAPKNLAAPDVAEAGNHVLDILIGDKHISRGIAQRTANETGIDDSIAKKLLPVVASLMMGRLQQQSQPGMEKLLREVPSLALSRNRSPLPLPGEVPMDSGTNGSESDAGVRPPMPAPRSPGRTVSGGSPLPIPGDNIPGMGRNAPDTPEDNPYKKLPDIIRRGGVQVPNGGSLEDVIRSILGGLLGFKNRGVIGTLIQAFILRWLANLARRLFSRIALGR